MEAYRALVPLFSNRELAMTILSGTCTLLHPRYPVLPALPPAPDHRGKVTALAKYESSTTMPLAAVPYCATPYSATLIRGELMKLHLFISILFVVKIITS